MSKSNPSTTKNLKRSGVFALAAAGFDAAVTVFDAFTHTWWGLFVLPPMCVALVWLGVVNLRNYRRQVSR